MGKAVTLQEVALSCLEILFLELICKVKEDGEENLLDDSTTTAESKLVDPVLSNILT